MSDPDSQEPDMGEPVREVCADLLMRANSAAEDGPRGFENSTVSIIDALSREVSTGDLVAISYRLQALSGLPMNLHGREYKLINEAAFKAAATCPLILRGAFGEVEFDREEFLRLALSFAEPAGNG